MSPVGASIKTLFTFCMTFNMPMYGIFLMLRNLQPFVIKPSAYFNIFSKRFSYWQMCSGNHCGPAVAKLQPKLTKKGTLSWDLE